MWIGRLAIAIGTLVLVGYAVALFGPPWASTAAAYPYAFLLGLALTVEVLLVEGTQLRWMLMSNDRAKFGYLTGVIEVDRAHLRPAPGRSIRGTRDVAYERLGASGALSKQFIWATEEQSKLISWWLAGEPT